jgi:hypothetical protein
MADQPEPTFITADAAERRTFPVNRGRYEIEPVDGFRIEVAAALAELERQVKAERERADAAEARMSEVTEAGAGDPFEGARALVDQQRRAQFDIDRAVGNARRWAEETTARAQAHAVKTIDQAEKEARTLLEDARRTATMATGAPAVPQPPVTGDQLTDGINLAEYVRVARQAHEDHAAKVHHELDEQLDQALEQLDGAVARAGEVRQALEAQRRPRGTGR